MPKKENKLVNTKEKKKKKKSSVHPDFGIIEVIMTDGTKFQTRSTLAKQSKSLDLAVCPKSHPAWNKGKQSDTSNSRFAKVKTFNEKFKGLGI